MMEQSPGRDQMNAIHESNSNIPSQGADAAKLTEHIELSMEDIADSTRAKQQLEASEIRYRRLFETAQDAILILDADTGKIFDANPFIAELLEFPREYFIDKELWQLGVFKDIEASKAAFQELRERKYVRFENMPLVTATGKPIEVEFVSNVYTVDSQQVIQCNIRDITEHKRLEAELRDHSQHKIGSFFR
jgi:PAS domain S-box-containing protein